MAESAGDALGPFLNGNLTIDFGHNGDGEKGRGEDGDEDSDEEERDDGRDDGRDGSIGAIGANATIQTNGNNGTNGGGDIDNKNLIERYERLKERVRTLNSEAHKGQAIPTVIQQLKELEDIYELVQRKHNRDTKVQLKDAEVFMDTSKFAAINARNLKFSDMGVSLTQGEFSKQVKSYMSNDAAHLHQNEPRDHGQHHGNASEYYFDTFDWLKLGCLYLSSSNRVIYADSLLGPLETEKRRQAPRTRTIDDTKNLELRTARTINASDFSGLEEKNTAQMVKHIYQTFINKKNSHAVNFYHFFINPYSFAQSVENLFFTSFLIKDSRLKIYRDENGNPFIDTVDPEELQSLFLNSEGETNHHIASFDYQTWSSLIKAYDITEPFLAHRPELEDLFQDGEDSSYEESF